MRNDAHRSRRYRHVRALALLSVLAVGVLVLPGAPAEAAFGPNLIVNGSFEVPVTLTGVSAPPYGICGAVVPLDPPGIATQTNEGCWTNSAGPTGSIYLDRTIAKGGKQSVVVAAPASNFAWLSQAVAAGPATYRLQFLATPESGSGPFTVSLWSLSSGAVIQESAVTFGPVAYVVNSNPLRIWTSYKLDITAPAGTDHLAVCLCGVLGQTARFDSVSLRQQL
jgi:hypothetical protein